MRGLQAMVWLPSTKEKSKGMVEDARTRIEQGTLRFCNVSRPFDWLILLVANVILVSDLSSLFPCFNAAFPRRFWLSSTSNETCRRYWII